MERVQAIGDSLVLALLQVSSTGRASGIVTGAESATVYDFIDADAWADWNGDDQKHGNRGLSKTRLHRVRDHHGCGSNNARAVLGQVREEEVLINSD